MGILSSRIGQCLIINYYIYYSIATFCEQLIEQNTFSLLSWGIYISYERLDLSQTHTPFTGNP